jgi:hypothetical protein
VTNKQILPKIEAEEQWRKFYSYDKPDSNTCLINSYPTQRQSNYYSMGMEIELILTKQT